MSLSPQGKEGSSPPPHLSASPAPFAPFITPPPLLQCCGRVPALVLEGVCGHILVAVAPSRSPRWPTFPSGLSLSPQPLHLPSFSPPLWPRLAPVASATRLLLCPAPLFECLTLRAELARWVRGLLLRQGASTCNLWKHKKSQYQLNRLRNYAFLLQVHWESQIWFKGCFFFFLVADEQLAL